MALQAVGVALGVNYDSRALGERLKSQVYLGVMPKWLEVSAADNGVGDGLAVEDLTLVKAHVETESVLYHAEQNLGLYLTHQGNCDLFGFGVVG